MAIFHYCMWITASHQHDDWPIYGDDDSCLYIIKLRFSWLLLLLTLQLETLSYSSKSGKEKEADILLSTI